VEVEVEVERKGKADFGPAFITGQESLVQYSVIVPYSMLI